MDRPVAAERSASGAATAGFVGAVVLGLCAIAFGGSEAATKADGLSASEVAKIAGAFRQARGTLLSVDLKSLGHTELVAMLHLPKADAEALAALVERGERALGRLTLRDNLDEDGDVASVTAGGYTQNVALASTPTPVLVAYVPGQPVLVTGEHDGLGGGVTIAVELSTGTLTLPPLAVGQTVALPIR